MIVGDEEERRDGQERRSGKKIEIYTMEKVRLIRF
jgi:hypothetical protein